MPKAKELLTEEIKLRKEKASKENKPEAGFESAQAYSRLGHCLTALSELKGSKEADGLFAQSISILDKELKAKGEVKPSAQDKPEDPKVVEARAAELQKVREYRASTAEEKGYNAFNLAKAAELGAVKDPVAAKAYYQTAETALNDSLKVLDNDPKYKDNQVRYRALINLAQAQDALGEKVASTETMKKIEGHPAYFGVLSEIQTRLMREVVDKAKATSPTAKLAEAEFSALPWHPQSRMIPAKAMPNEKPDSPDSGYDANSGILYLTDKITKQEDIPQKFANQAYMAAHQSLYRKYHGELQPGDAKDIPIDAASFQTLKREQVAGGLAREVAVASELHNNKPVNYRIADKDTDLQTLAVKKPGTEEIDLAKTTTAIAKFIEGDKFIASRWQRDHEAYVKGYAQDKQTMAALFKANPDFFKPNLDH